MIRVFWQVWEGSADERPGNEPAPSDYVIDDGSTWEPFGYSGGRVAWRRALVHRPPTATEETIDMIKGRWKYHAAGCRVCITEHALCLEGSQFYSALQEHLRRKIEEMK